MKRPTGLLKAIEVKANKKPFRIASILEGHFQAESGGDAGI
ncbi:MAG: hypothetical protein ACR2PH_13405 [Desulfobulbia bacterium]